MKRGESEEKVNDNTTIMIFIQNNDGWSLAWNAY